MLWEIRDFKGIERGQLDIRPGKATILTGVNSSGKSSTLQSLLLVAQSLYNDGPIVLNGPLVRLGDAKDLVREGSSTGHIGIRLGIDRRLVDTATADTKLDAEYELVANEDLSSLRARRITVRSSEHMSNPLELSRANSVSSDVQLVLNATAGVGPREALHLKSSLASEKRQLRTYVVMQGLRPVLVIQLLTPERVTAEYRNSLMSAIAGLDRTASSGAARPSLTPPAVREFLRLLAEASQTDPTARAFRDQFSPARGGNPYGFASAWHAMDEKSRAQVVDIVTAQRATRPYLSIPISGRAANYSPTAVGLLESTLGAKLDHTVEALSALSATLDEVARRVQYLGPLRDEPRVVWNHWNELARGLPVGTRGEFSAAVLSRSANSHVLYRGPGRKQQEVGRLSNAVNEWLDYLEIGDRISAKARGKLGVGFELQFKGHLRDLTSVGVGVSQTLPLLVGLLSAPHNSVFIVEQPELHLHPAVQARLADFMLTARPDVALIIETHSESFITRIRRRAAEGTLETSDVDITFVEPTHEGATTRTLRLSEFGDLDEWPDGFLGTAEEDIRAILQMNVKRARGAHVDK